MLEQKTTAPAAPAPKHRRPILGDDVWFYDNTRAANYSKQGAGPYAAKVVFADVGGLTLKIFAPHAVFDADRVPHESELDAKAADTRKRWWGWPERK